MEKKKLYIGISIILVVIALFFVASNFFSITGRLGSVYRTCVDTDGGDNQYVNGTVFYSVYNRKSEYTDYCFARTGKGPEKWLNEYYCDANENIYSRDYNCEDYRSKCVNGKCIPVETEPCTDSDDGLNYGVKGTACVGSNCKEDLCLDEIYLSESYCENDVKQKIYKCTDGCANGVCSGL